MFEKFIRSFIFLSLKKIRIKKNDTVFISTDLKNLYFPFLTFLKRDNNLLDEKYLSELFFDIIKEYFLPNGTVIFPSYSWSFIKKKYFNPKKTKPELGILEKNIFSKKGVYRSIHPTNSIIAIGKKSKFVTEKHGLFSFGANSPFHKFHKINLKFLNIGVPFYNSCTYVHHLEHLNGINHRFYKPISGKIINHGKSIRNIYYILVKYHYFNRIFERNEKRLYQKLLKMKKVNKITQKKILFSNISCKDVYDVGLSMLEKNPSAFMKNNITVKFIEGEETLKKKYTKYINFKLVKSNS